MCKERDEGLTECTSKWYLHNTVLDRNSFDACPYPKQTFYFDVDPDPDPPIVKQGKVNNWYLNFKCTKAAERHVKQSKASSRKYLNYQQRIGPQLL
jgi:hypothetical protein